MTDNSATTHDFSGAEVFSFCAAAPVAFSSTTPQSVNFDFQTGVAADTLVFGSIRWVDWTAFDITPPGYAIFPNGSLVDYSNGVITYSLGIGRKFSHSFQGLFPWPMKHPLAHRPRTWLRQTV